MEHPADSLAWAAHGLIAPPRSGGWVSAGDWQGFTCCVEQGHYGHLARKATWLYAVDCDFPVLRWGKSEAKVRLDDGYHSTEERRRAVKRGVVERLPASQRSVTPLPFRDVLLASSSIPGFFQPVMFLQPIAIGTPGGVFLGRFA